MNKNIKRASWEHSIETYTGNNTKKSLGLLVLAVILAIFVGTVLGVLSALS